MADEKVYCGQGKVLPGRDGMPARLKFSLSKREVELLAEWAKETGWVNVVVSKRRTPSEKGVTHYGVIDTWKPTPRSEPVDARSPGSTVAAPAAAAAVEAEEEMPF
jgi:hypothetical protein